MKTEYTQEDKIKFYEAELVNALNIIVRSEDLYKKIFVIGRIIWIANRLQNLLRQKANE